MRVGRHNRYVTLWQRPQVPGDSDGFWEALSPPTSWCRLEPGPPGSGADGQTTQHLVTMRFHPQVSTDAKLTYADPLLRRNRDFMVMDVQNVGDQNTEMRLLVEEVGP